MLSTEVERESGREDVRERKGVCVCCQIFIQQRKHILLIFLGPLLSALASRAIFRTRYENLLQNKITVGYARQLVYSESAWQSSTLDLFEI